jgi:glycosyltransferase involved in cell wall biosynthesis
MVRRDFPSRFWAAGLAWPRRIIIVMTTQSWMGSYLTGTGIRHKSIEAANAETEGDPTDRMTIFWSGDRAVGHVFNFPDEERSKGPGVDQNLIARVVGERDSELKPQHSASVVICTRDRQDELRRCLSSLPRQSYVPREVIVVDNASRDGQTREVAEAAGVIYVREDRPGLDIARNTGAVRATSEIVAYTDDDVLLHPRWLERMVAAFDAPQIGAVTGLVLPAELATMAQLHFETFWSFGQGYERRDHDAVGFASANGAVYPAWKVGAGASMAFRREVFDKVGWFDERLDVGQAGCSGDSEYWYRLLANGYVCRYDPASIAFHFHRRTWEGLSSQIYHYMRGHAAALMVQYERTGIAANRKRAFFGMPRWYAARLLSRVRGKKTPADRFLKEEIMGYFSGLLFYYKAARPESRLPP